MDRWVSAGYLRKKKLIGDNSQHRDLVIRLGQEKEILERAKFYYFNKKQVKSKNNLEATRKKLKNPKDYNASSCEVYRLKSDKETFKKLFLFFYNTEHIWEFVLSRYCKENCQFTGFDILRTFATHEYVKKGLKLKGDINNKLIFDRFHDLHSTPKSLIYLYLSNPKNFYKILTDYVTKYWFEDMLKGKNTEGLSKEIFNFYILKLEEMFWTYDLFMAPDKDVKIYDAGGKGLFNVKDYCYKRISEIREMQKYYKNKKEVKARS